MSRDFVPFDVINRDTGERVTALTEQAAVDFSQRSGWEKVETPKDGFRKRRTRPKGWLKKAIESGEVADPALGGQPPQTYGPGVHVVDVPLAEMEGGGKI